MMLLVLPLSLALATPPSALGAGARSSRNRRKQALIEAFGHRSYVLLVLGFFTCGFQLAFVTVHLPAYLVDRGLGADIGAWTIALHRPVQHRRLARRRAGCPAGCRSATCCRSSISAARSRSSA